MGECRFARNHSCELAGLDRAVSIEGCNRRGPQHLGRGPHQSAQRRCRFADRDEGWDRLRATWRRLLPGWRFVPCSDATVGQPTSVKAARSGDASVRRDAACSSLLYSAFEPGGQANGKAEVVPGLADIYLARGVPNRPHDAIPVEITFPQHPRSRLMNFDTASRVPIFAVPHVHLSDYTTEMANRTMRAGSVRSVGNIRLWSSYLPEDCVNTMIKMGWDRTA